MALEIERKFLLANQDWKSQVIQNKVISQGYLSTLGKTDSHSSTSKIPTTIRIRIIEDEAFITIKSSTIGITRSEFEYSVPVEDAKEMMKLANNVVEKIRHYVPVENYTFEIDEFLGDNAGLVVAEIELPNENTHFHKPEWLGEEVSHDNKYFNSSLAENPYKKWEDAKVNKTQGKGIRQTQAKFKEIKGSGPIHF